MTPTWKFRPMGLAEQNRDPIEDEFFRRESGRASLVREFIQNSLDAAAGTGPVRVRFYISGTDFAVAPTDADRWFRALQPHLDAAGFDSTVFDETMGFVVAEDFGTRGLEGDPRAATEGELCGEREDYYYFYRNVGITGKKGAERGSRGLGKAVYASSSRARSCLSWTIRESDRRSLLMGQSVLAVHQYPDPDGIKVRHDAYGMFGEFGTRRDDRDRTFATPIEDTGMIRDFKRVFRLERSSEPGLSIVIPYAHKEMILNPEPVVDSYAIEAIRQYAHPILQGHLVVEIESPRGKVILDREALLERLDELDWGATEKKDRGELLRLQRYIELARWSIEDAEPIELRLKDVTTKACSWDEIDLNAELLQDARERYTATEKLAFRVPVVVRPRKGSVISSYFDIFLQHDPSLAGSEVKFVRQGLTLTEAKGVAAKGLLCIVLVEHTPLALLLRAAENPAHTKWFPREEQLRKEFTGGAARIQFVESAPRRLLRLLLGGTDEQDFSLLAEFFPDPDPEASLPSTAGSKRGKKRKKKLSQPPPPKPKAINIEKLSTGFTIRRNPGVALNSPLLVVDVAFDCVGSNPFKAYEPFDFRVSHAPIKTHVVGGQIEEKRDNRILVRVENADFHLDVRGFPEDRDLVVRHRWLDVRDEEELEG